MCTELSDVMCHCQGSLCRTKVRGKVGHPACSGAAQEVQALIDESSATKLNYQQFTETVTDLQARVQQTKQLLSACQNHESSDTETLNKLKDQLETAKLVD